jgi:hypothetical protein
MHNPANKHKMTKEGFVRNNRGIDGDGDLPREMLEGVSGTEKSGQEPTRKSVRKSLSHETDL